MNITMNIFTSTLNSAILGWKDMKTERQVCSWYFALFFYLLSFFSFTFLVWQLYLYQSALKHLGIMQALQTETHTSCLQLQGFFSSPGVGVGLGKKRIYFFHLPGSLYLQRTVFYSVFRCCNKITQTGLFTKQMEP